MVTRRFGPGEQDFGRVLPTFRILGLQQAHQPSPQASTSWLLAQWLSVACLALAAGRLLLLDALGSGPLGNVEGLQVEHPVQDGVPLDGARAGQDARQ